MSEEKIALDYGKIPPQAIDLEEAVLGAALIDREAIDGLLEILRPEMFYKQAHQVIFEAVINLHTNHKPVDLLTITEELRTKEKLELVGGAVYITTLTSRIGSAAHAPYHSRIVAQKYVLREVIRISSEATERAFDESSDVEDILDVINIGLESIHKIIHSGSEARSYGEIVKQSLDEYYEREQQFKENIVPGLPTPVKDIDRMTGGWMNSDLIVVAGRPSMGKTAFALAVINEIAKNGKWANVYSLEMSAVRLVDRMLSGKANINAEKYRDGALNSDEYNRIKEVADASMNETIIIDPKPVVNMNYVLSRSRINKKKGRCDFILIDYLQLVDETDGGKGRNREQAVSDISRRAKLIAKELDIPVMVLAQLNRSCELRGADKRPWLADLRESGAIEQDADIVAFMFREERYDKSAEKGKGEFIISKNRNGKIGTTFFGYNSEMTQIFDYVQKEPDIADSTISPDNHIESSRKFNDFEDPGEMPF